MGEQEMNLSGMMSEIHGYFEEKEPAKAEALIRKVLERQDLSNNERIEFQYTLGISLDYQKRYFDALEVFLQVQQQSPLCFTYLQSLRICLRNIASEAGALMRSEPSSEKIFLYEETLLKMDWCPGMIRLHAALLRAMKGERDRALQIARAYLELNPNDADFLRGAHRIARAAGDTQLQAQIERQVSGILSRKPYRNELWNILEAVC
jgi:tetratricopeptide (TPR) repeat protein